MGPSGTSGRKEAPSVTRLEHKSVSSYPAEPPHTAAIFVRPPCPNASSLNKSFRGWSGQTNSYTSVKSEEHRPTASAHPGVPTARYEVVKQHACGPREAPFASTPQVCILRRNWIIFPGLLRAIIREPLQLPNNPATALVRGSYRYTSVLVYMCTSAPVYRCARVLV